MKQTIKLLLCIPKIVLFNFYVFPLSVAVKLPVYISTDTKIDGVRRGSIEILGPIKRGMIKIGFTGVKGVVGKRKTYLRCGNEEGTARIIFYGDARISSGALISVDRGILTLGKNVMINDNLYLSCNHRITFEDDVLVGWNVRIMDSDNHTIYEKGKEKDSVGPIFIGANTWVASDVKILKNTYVYHDSVIATESLVTRNFNTSNVLIAGNPAQVIKNDITWSHEAKYTLKEKEIHNLEDFIDV